MANYRWAALWLIALLLGTLPYGFAAGSEQAPEGDDVVTPSGGPITLFDGKTLGDCYTWLKDSQRDDPRRVFRVTDGLLHITGDGLGALVTNQSFRDYHLILEYRWGERTWRDRENAARDSGLLIHSNGVDGGYQGIWMPSIEVQIIEGGVGDFILVNGQDQEGRPVPVSLTATVGRDRDGEVVWQESGTRETFDNQNRRRINWRDRDPDWQDVRGYRGAQDVESPGQQWTRLDVVAQGDHIATYVNGVKVNEAFQVTPAAGRLQLQSELAELFIRRWQLYPLDGAPPLAPAEQ